MGHALNTKQGTAVFSIDRETKKILVVHRREDEALVCFPGGKVDPGETYLQAAQRELLEETGLFGQLEDFELVSEGVFHNLVDNIDYAEKMFFIEYSKLTQKTQNFEDFTKPHLISFDEFKDKNFNPKHFEEMFQKPKIAGILKEFGLINTYKSPKI